LYLKANESFLIRQTLIFISAEQLLEFLSVADAITYHIDLKMFECCGSYLEAEIELALNGMNVRIKQHQVARIHNNRNLL
jgi:hypothetical protein